MSNGLPVVVIDPGHGGTVNVGGSSSNNATGPNGLLEKDVTLALALQVEAQLNSMGSARVILTRRTDVNLPLVDRANVAKNNNAAIFLSIHLNGWSDAAVDGTEIWVVRSANAQSRAFASLVLNNLVAVTKVKNRGVRESDLGVLLPSRHAANTAACLAEIAFLTNADQADRLTNDGYKNLLAQAMSEAILQRLPAPTGVTHSLEMVGAGSAGYSPRGAATTPVTSSGYRSLSTMADKRARAGTFTLSTTTVNFGVPNGKITDPFYNDPDERQQLTGRQHGRKKHLGVDVSLSNDHGGGADDPRRGLPVYAALKPTISLSELNAVRTVDSQGRAQKGLGISGQGNATLQNALVLAQPWSSKESDAYGGVIGLACRYAYTKADNSPGRFTLYIEYLHLITPDFLPKDGDGQSIAADTWKATGKGIGFGPQMQNRAQLTADQLTKGTPLLVGYLGATQFPHVHIQAAYGDGQQGYIRAPRFDPTVMLINTLQI